jgi:hypothetical protein
MTAPGGYATFGTVRDDGRVFGAELITDNPVRQVAAFWPSPQTIEVIPSLDGKTVRQSMVDLSPQGHLLLGLSADDSNSVGPTRAFVYSRDNGSFHVLAISGPEDARVFGSSFVDDDTVVGATSSFSEHFVRSFTYHLSTDTYEVAPGDGPVSDDPGYPQEGTSRRIFAYSRNRLYGAGQLTLNGHLRFAIWSLGQHTYRLVGPSDVQGSSSGVSDDGAVALFTTATEPSHTWICTAEGQFHDVLELVRANGVGQDWGRIARAGLSPNGRYILVSGGSGNFPSSSARITLR